MSWRGRERGGALRAEADEYVERFSDERDEDGHRQVVRNGRAQERRVTVGSGTIPVRAPRVNDKRVDDESGERQRFSSRILPAYARRSPKVGEVIPILYLRGLSTGDFRPALEGLLARTPPASRPRRSVGCARSGRPITTGFGSGCCPSAGTRTCSWTGSMFRSVSVRTRRCVC
jgi:transposase-like protein